MIIEVGKKYTATGCYVYELALIGETQVALKKGNGKLFIEDYSYFKETYREYVEPKKTKVTKVAEYFSNLTKRVETVEVGRESQYMQLVIGSERTIEISEE